MKKTFALLLLLSLCSNNITAQANAEESKDTVGYVFTDKIINKTTSVKNQHRSGTCWSYSTISFLESEMLRKGKQEVDLSDMFAVSICYVEKAKKYARMHGTIEYAQGGAAHDIIWVLKNFGLMPEEAYKGANYGTELPEHAEIESVLRSIVDAVVKQGERRNAKLTTAWLPAVKAVVDTYFGSIPEQFEYNGKKYTPRSFADEITGLNADDYVAFTSFSHHPFYESFILEVPDNWMWESMNNIPLDDLIAITDNALKNGYTVAWGADVSEDGFSYKDGVAVIPETKEENLEGTELSRWQSLKGNEKKQYGLNAPVKEIKVTQEMRQEAFDNYQTTDDHGMHIIGIAVDQNGTEYYKVKNSWDSKNKYNGYLYVSKAYFAYKTMDIMVHKDAIPKTIAKKLK